MDGKFGHLQQKALHWHNRLRQAMASCHGLTLVNKATVVGDELEHYLFKAVEAAFLVRCTVLCCRCYAAPCSAVMCCAVLCYTMLCWHLSTV